MTASLAVLIIVALAILVVVCRYFYDSGQRRANRAWLDILALSEGQSYSPTLWRLRSIWYARHGLSDDDIRDQWREYFRERKRRK